MTLALRILAIPIAAWCALAGAVGLYRVIHDGWPQAALPAGVFLAIAATLLHYTITGRLPWSST